MYDLVADYLLGSPRFLKALVHAGVETGAKAPSARYRDVRLGQGEN
jgi:hypothetical protein